jgi:hypothetical protein
MYMVCAHTLTQLETHTLLRYHYYFYYYCLLTILSRFEMVNVKIR